MADDQANDVAEYECDHADKHRFACLLCGKIICSQCKAAHAKPHGTSETPAL